MVDLRTLLRRHGSRASDPAPIAPAIAPAWGTTTSRRLVGVGHSHLQAIQDACQLRQQADPARAPVPGFVQMLAPELTPTLMPDGSLNPKLLAAISSAMIGDDLSEPFVFDCVSGNEYYFIGLVNHPRRFDFVLPSRPELPLAPGAEIIPSDLMRRSLHAQMRHALAILTALAHSLPCRFWHVQSPPPLPDNDHIRLHPTHFAAQVAEHGISPPGLRMKLWVLQSEIYRDHCQATGIGFLPVPDEATDAGGFLDRRGWLPDPAHANNWYGELVVRQLDALTDRVRQEALS